MALVSAFVTPLARSLWLMTIPPLHPYTITMNNTAHTQRQYFLLCFRVFALVVVDIVVLFSKPIFVYFYICDVQMCLHVGC